MDVQLGDSLLLHIAVNGSHDAMLWRDTLIFHAHFFFTSFDQMTCLLLPRQLFAYTDRYEPWVGLTSNPDYLY